MRLFPVICLLVLILGAAGSAADDFVYHGSFLWNDIRSIVNEGDYLFCAFYNGIGVIDVTRDFNKKKLAAQLEMPYHPLRLYKFGTTLVTENEGGTISLIDASDVSAMQLMGTMTAPENSLDLAIMDSYLYIAVEYDGIKRFDISDPSHIVFNDSSMFGIRVIDVEVYGDHLLALDDYNGILVYDNGPDFGLPISELFLPEQAISFTVHADTVYASLRPTGYLVGSLENILAPVYLERRETYILGAKLEILDDRIVVSNSTNGFELIYEEDGSIVHRLYPVTDILGYSTLFRYDNRRHIAFPHRQRGFVAFDIENPLLIDVGYPTMVYAYPGPITQVSFFKSRLHVIGTNNWYEMYDVSDPGHPVRSGRMINPPYQPAGFCTKGDTLFITDVETNSFFPAIDDGSGDPVSIFPLFSVSDSVTRPHILVDYFEHGDLLYYYNHQYFNGTLRNDSSVTPNRLRWGFADGVMAAAIIDTAFYQANNKGLLWIYAIDKHYDLDMVTSRNLPGRVRQMVRNGRLMYMASGGLVTVDILDPFDPAFIYFNNEIGQVAEICMVDDWLACAAQNGLFVYDISSNGIPQLVFSGGDPATLVAYDPISNTVVASDGKSVKIYTLPILDSDSGEEPIADRFSVPTVSGYPNPFNPAIHLTLSNFSSRAGRVVVDVFDILGRRVRHIEGSGLSTGDEEIAWDGRDENGEIVASGVYLFRAYNETEQAVYKAILLK